MVRNPMNRRRLFSVSLSPDVVDCIVFWTKNPAPFLSRIDLLRDYQFYFQFTLTPYDERIEPNVPGKERVIESFVALAEKIGKERVVWRYDPIIVTDDMDVRYHVDAFEHFASRLQGCAVKCAISFVDFYRHIGGHFEALGIERLGEKKIRQIAENIVPVAHDHGFVLESCAEETDLSDLGINHGKCIDDRLISKIIGADVVVERDKAQRKSCGCVASIDIGSYNTCGHGCLYCYANFSRKAVEKIMASHDPDSPLIAGRPGEGETATERRVASCRPRAGACGSLQGSLY